MFGEYSARELALWIGGTLAAAVFVFFAAVFAVDHWIAPHTVGDPLAKQGGLKASQDPKLAN